jgi:hypothetical protein
MQSVALNQIKTNPAEQSQLTMKNAKKAERFSNLLFVVFNLVFFAALLVMLPALGDSKEQAFYSVKSARVSNEAHSVVQSGSFFTNIAATGKSSLKEALTFLQASAGLK